MRFSTIYICDYVNRFAIIKEKRKEVDTVAKRRSNNEGTLFRRSDGKYVAKITVGWKENGQPKYKYFVGDSQEDVLKRWEEAKGEVRTGVFVEPNKVLFKDWINVWLDTVKKNSLRNSTRTLYRSLADNHIIPAIGGIKLQKLQAAHIQELYNASQEKGLKPQTIIHFHKIVNGSIKQAIKEQLLTFNPCTAVVLPKIEEQEMQTISIEQAKEFLEVARTHRLYKRLYAAYLTELYTGLRRGELLGLRWRDVDLKGCKISINQQLITENGKPVISPLKTKGSKRTIAIPGEVSEAIKAYKDFKRAELKDNGFNDIQIKEMLAPDKILFTTSEGTPFEPGNFVRNFKSLLKTVGLPEDLRFHDMRHSFAVISLQQGVDIKTLQSDMGHTSIETTLDRYGHVNEDMKRAAANKRAGTFS